ncbi:MAG: hypothetical protein K0S92_370, partial [Desertimonas sp.]|nr:hypothetical protein [Desertimonas sp.]
VLLVVAVAGTVVMTRRERKPSLRSPATQAANDRSPAGASSLAPEDAT